MNIFNHKYPLFNEVQDETTHTAGGAVEDKQESGEVTGSGNDARLAMLNDIADKAEDEVADQLQDVNDDETTSPFRTERADNAQNESDKQTDTSTDVAADSTPPSDSEVKKFKLKVNGKELELTEEELIARAQKVEAADEYLRTAKESVKSVKPTTPQFSQEELQRAQDAEDLKLAQAIQMGSTEEAMAALRLLRQQARGTPSMSMDDVSAAIDQRLEFRTAFNNFTQEFKEIADDPVLFKIARDKDQELIESGDTRPYSERYREIGNNLRGWLKTVRGSSSTEQKFDDKQRRKESAPTVPSAAAVKAPPTKQPDDREETTQDTIAAMRQARGGPQWMRG